MKTHKPTKTTRGACRTTRTAAAVVADVAPATKRSATRTRGAKASSKAPLPAHVRAALPDLSAAQRLVDAEAERLAAIAAALES